MEATGKPELFLIVIEKNKGIVYKCANAYCKDEENRKDLIQEIMIQLWLAFDKYDNKYKISTWMYRIALNVSISFYRKENRRTEINKPLTNSILYLQDEYTSIKFNEEIDHLNQFIRELKEIDRAVMLLYLEGNSQQETALILGLSETNISTKVSRIKQQLKQKFAAIKNY
jgi:RNA polymerase sigma factor (sigma-70 family)